MMYKEKHVSLIIPAYNEEGNIKAVLEDFSGSPLLDEIVVVDNNSSDRTAEKARNAGARVLTEMRQGYGHALRCGIEGATGDLLILTEADGSFRSADVEKLLAFSDDADLVLGNRTTWLFIAPGARMNSIIRLANICVGKLVQMCWWLSNPTRLSDVGCTYRAISRSAYERIAVHLSAEGPEFSTEMMAEALCRGLRVVEIPVHYGARALGESKHSGTYVRLARTALRMLHTLFRKRLSMR